MACGPQDPKRERYPANLAEISSPSLPDQFQFSMTFTSPRRNRILTAPSVVFPQAIAPSYYNPHLSFLAAPTAPPLPPSTSTQAQQSNKQRFVEEDHNDHIDDSDDVLYSAENDNPFHQALDQTAKDELQIDGNEVCLMIVDSFFTDIS
jgi:hypothetical protein